MLQGIGVAAAGTLLGVIGCGGSGGGMGQPMPDAGSGTPCAANSVCLDLSQPANAALRAPGGSVVVPISGDKLIVIRVSDAEVDALSDICTHQGCSVGYSTSLNRLVCPCHGSQFQLNGSVAKGPATRPLRVYTATLDPATNIVTIAIA